MYVYYFHIVAGNISECTLSAFRCVDMRGLLCVCYKLLFHIVAGNIPECTLSDQCVTAPTCVWDRNQRFQMALNLFLLYISLIY